MIAYVEGRLAETTENACVLVTPGGVGYEVFLPAHLFSQLPQRGEMAFFYTCTVVREDALELFGFSTWDERQTFLVLTSINRVGARTALAILSVFRPDDLRHLILDDDYTHLTRVSGIGKKTAQQIFLELKYKMKVDDVPMAKSPGASLKNTVVQDTVAGLVNLGYDEEESLQVVKKVFAAEADLDVGGALRASLKLLAKGR